ncbi:HEAT repeat domain-containing protein [Pontimicrobium sp. MEBiC06410]
MPNGGSDCCGTCWFNSKNDGELGYHGSRKEGVATCQIRDLEIEDPFYTYCINHPHHNPNRVEIPLGPVYFGEDRQILIESPDTKETRDSLLKLLREIEEIPKDEYPAGRALDEEIITQIGKLEEKRAIPSLRKITHFNPLSQPKGKNPFRRNRIITVGLAVETLAKLSKNEAIPEIERLIQLGIQTLDLKNYNPKEDKLAPIRYHAARGLKYCSNNKSIELLKLGMRDPHQEIKAFSKDILEKKISAIEISTIEKEIEFEELNRKFNTQTKKANDSNKWWEFWKKNN